MVILIWVISNIMDILTLEIKKWVIGLFPDCKVASSLENLYVQTFKIFLPKWEASTASLKKLKEKIPGSGQWKKKPRKPRDDSLGALNPATAKIKTLDSHPAILITGCSSGLFCLAECLLKRGEFFMDVSQSSACTWCILERQLSVFTRCVWLVYKQREASSTV